MTRSERVSAERQPPRETPETSRPQRTAPLQPARTAAEIAADAAAARQFQRAMQRCREKLAGLSETKSAALQDSRAGRQPPKDELRVRRESAEAPGAPPAPGAPSEAAGRQGEGAPSAAATFSAAPGYAADAEAFADIFIRQALTSNRDPSRLRLAFADAGWPLTRIDLTSGQGGRLTITLGANADNVDLLEERLGELHEKLAGKGLCAGGFDIVVAAADADDEDAV